MQGRQPPHDLPPCPWLIGANWLWLTVRVMQPEVRVSLTFYTKLSRNRETSV
jgi:hypothetical protein